MAKKNSKKLENLIEEQVNCKVKELNTWRNVKWPGGRLFSEANKIKKEIAHYNVKTQIMYLKLLSTKNILLQDNTPIDAPDITSSFLNWLHTSISMKEISLLEEQKIKNGNRFNTLDKNNEFLITFINGIYELQQQDDKADCIIAIKSGNNNERSFQYYFKTYFSSKYDSVEAEPQKGNGRIDLKIKDKKIGTKIIEFKGWWNNDKKKITEQIFEYLTDFEKEGYIFMINNNKKKKIVERYKNEIIISKMNYVENSWNTIVYNNTNFKYYLSKHNINKCEKSLYHFVFDVY